MRPDITNRLCRLAISLVMFGPSIMGLAAAQAQSDECAKLGQVLMARGKLIEEVSRYDKKRPTPDAACATFTKLVESTNASIVEVEKNGVWCHVPPEALPALKGQQEGISKARANACAAAVQMKKQQEEARKSPLLGGGSVLGGPVKVPQGAL
jgi:hypothetical protein